LKFVNNSFSETSDINASIRFAVSSSIREPYFNIAIKKKQSIAKAWVCRIYMVQKRLDGVLANNRHDAKKRI
jgi:hypothetical protein